MAHSACRAKGGDLDARLEVFHRVPIGLVVWQLEDPADVRSLRLVDFNSAAERESGVSIGDRIGKAISEISPALLETDIPERCRHVIVSGKPETIGEVRYGDAHVPEGVFWLNCFPLPANCVGVAFENITERKKVEESKSRALRLLHRITLAINESASVRDAAQICLTDVCTHIGWPVGRLFLTDADCVRRFLPNPIWHFSDSHRFKAFREATEMYERDLTNEFVLEYRVLQGKKAGLTRSVGFSVLERNSLRAVLEFSSETEAPLDDSLVSAIGDIGVQLGRVFEREGAKVAVSDLAERLDHQEEERRAAARKFQACTGRYAAWLKASLESLNARKRHGVGPTVPELANSVKLMRRYVAEMSKIGSSPVEFRQNERRRRSARAS